MRRSVVAIFAALFAFTLPAAAPAPLILGTPVLVVYPFAANGSAISREAGAQLAVTIATQIANLGGVDVKPATPGTERQDFLDAAHRAGADYYIAGYMTPLGDGVSVVEQLVNAQTGIVVYSNTAQVRTFADAAGQGDILRDALLRHQARNLGAYAAPPPPAVAATPTPAAGSATEANLGRLFSHKQKRESAGASPSPSPAALIAAASPTASPAAVAALASPTARALSRGAGYAVLAIGGPAADDRRTFAGAALRNDILASHATVANAVVTRDAACQTNSVDTLVGGNLATSNHRFLGERQTTATLELLAYDCAGNVVFHQTFARRARGDWKDAVDSVVAVAVAAFLHAPPSRRS